MEGMGNSVNRNKQDSGKMDPREMPSGTKVWIYLRRVSDDEKSVAAQDAES